MLKIRRLIGKILNPLFPGWGWCYNCERKWAICKTHTTQYTEWNSCFPLCESCWKELTPKERLPFYERLVKEWVKSYENQNIEISDIVINKAPLIMQAVLEGK